MSDADLIAQVRRDLAEVAEQRASGELDEATAQKLAATYEAEMDRLMTSGETLQDPPANRRSGVRLLVGAAVLIVAFAGITWAASGAIVGREPDAFSGPDRQVDLESISNEQMIEVIAANADIPEINRMRLALAERYFESGEYSEALTWFQSVLDAAPSPLEESEALGRIGWMILDSGDAETALRFVDMSLEANPANLEATYFRGLTYARLGRTAEALADLREVAASSDLPDDVRAVVTEAIAALEDDS
ncbi:MAG: tetratricopeptide repeat protein [Acidimicrobiia bacterium]|nr:tetratricopeptide repeat protein [Acidimicrobiia bacterium]